MGKWESELQRLTERSAENKKAIDDMLAYWEKVVDAAQAFVSAHSKGASKLTKANSQLLDAEEDCAKYAVDLMDLEEKYEAAKKDKKKDEMEEIEGKMKPLIKNFENGRKEHKTAVDDGMKVGKEVNDLRDALKAALG
jgi:DNA repair exonuclease SbcCD ATPase subunit